MSDHNSSDCAPLVRQLGSYLLSRNLTLAVAESCTGGWIAKQLTDVPGSSDWFDCGFVTYSNASKQAMLGVAAETIREYGAVSEAVVIAMAAGARLRSQAQLTLAVSGIAGPGGEQPGKPIGTVWFAWQSFDGQQKTLKSQLSGDRAAIRAQAVRIALQGVLDHYTV